MIDGIVDLLHIKSEEATDTIISFSSLDAVNTFIRKYSLSPTYIDTIHKLDKIEYFINLNDILPSK